MKKLIITLALAAFAAGCSHNPVGMVFGKQMKAGNIEYGEISYLNGLAIVDVSRENSSWCIEVNDEAGLQWDATTNTLKGVKKIERKIGKQVTGYLNDLAEKSPEAVIEYFRGGEPAPEPATAEEAK